MIKQNPPNVDDKQKCSHIHLSNLGSEFGDLLRPPGPNDLPWQLVALGLLLPATMCIGEFILSGIEAGFMLLILWMNRSNEPSGESALITYQKIYYSAREHTVFIHEDEHLPATRDNLLKLIEQYTEKSK